ncbi:hypothetical protein SAMN05444408_10238 [Chryseobacterium takakiae]|uniref:Transmembrane protein n=1 Tax=Chryseobacterium takakiae TaxID=1302685 RepID=A0A1M4UCY7_9FLAO|nr:hypothetical protein SAMN05444408_10238 [Chryseobacterium takakiae]
MNIYKFGNFQIIIIKKKDRLKTVLFFDYNYLYQSIFFTSIQPVYLIGVFLLLGSFQLISNQ